MKFEFYKLKAVEIELLLLAYRDDNYDLVSLFLYINNPVFDAQLYTINRFNNTPSPVFTKLSKEEATEYMLNNCPDIHDLFFTKII